MSSTALQRKIFTRWVRQKVAKRDVKVNDIVDDLGDGILLVALMEELSEKHFPKKLTVPPKMRVQNIDNCNNALDFCWSCGVAPELKPSAENLVDKTEKQILGLIWAIMRKYLKFGDDVDEKLDAQDALLMWVQNQTQGYKGVEVKDFGKSFHDGLALCALIHKFRPKLIDFDSLDAANKEANLKTAFAAAEKYFGLEQYLQPSDIAKLDDKSLLIYVSEYYYGIANQRKIDLAGRRVAKLIKFTKDNDNAKNDYNQRAQKLRESLDRVTKVLNDRTIDNTIAGAKRRIEEFYEYKKNDKGAIIADFLGLESLFNNLAMRLAEHKRPEFKPNAGLSVKELRDAINALEKTEQERAVALNAELNRQYRLAHLNEYHQSLSAKLNEWLSSKTTYLNHKENVDSVGAAEFQLNALSAFDKESEAVQKSTWADLQKVGSELVDQKFEGTAAVQERENAGKTALATLPGLAASKRQALEADKAREIKKEQLRLRFAGLAADFNLWVKNAISTVQASQFGFTYPEVQAYANELASHSAAVKGEAEKKKAEYEGVDGELKQLAVKENVYTSSSVGDLNTSFGNLTAALGEREGKYKTELERQRANDDLCKQFAAAASPIAESIVKNKDQITNSQAGLEDQLAFVNQRLGDTAGFGQQLGTVNDLQGKIDAAGVRYNPHSHLTAKDVQVQYEQYVDFLNRKKKMLEEEIEHKKLRGVTVEQMKEIEAQFRHFDKNKNNKIELKEFKACLYSLGEERKNDEIKEILGKFGDGSGISIDGFKEFMINNLGDNDTKDEINAGFKLINRGAEVAKIDLIDQVLSAEDVDYLKQNAPQGDGGLNYQAWSESVFSR